MTKKSYHWEIQPMEDVKPHFVFTDEDSALAAMQQFEDNWGKVSVSSVRKIAETFHYEHEEAI